MGEILHYKGKLRKLPKIEAETLESQCKRYVNKEGLTDLPKEYNSWEDVIVSEFWDKYIIIRENLYKILEKREIKYNDFYESTDNRNGTYDFDVKYYSDISFSEALEKAFNNK